ncbi:hypothetical protein K0651_01375 [Ornithinimicrobium sp. Arc0846-15]|nr:hypothetical protein [Ornithinimicrobium laminariae]
MATSFSSFDDEPIARGVLAQLLTECEYQVLLASGVIKPLSCSTNTVRASKPS